MTLFNDGTVVLDNRCTLTSFNDDTKLEEVTNKTKGRAAIQMDLSTLEEWADMT